ncbi:HBL/NHE enterotoxin family protein [Bacillus spongiae]|uniref:HBL/NHE enterotoxin family protein n=1 Tax=Bacillus spongiae TaxID=2683610 RepID=A0ABU8HFJ9_9BACI
MKKIPYKVMALSTLIAMSANNLIPVQALAEDRATIATATVTDADQHQGYSLGPQGLREAMESTGSNALVMDLYALTIIKHGDVNFNGITTVSDVLKTDILHHQSVARNNANYWLDSLKPQLISTNQNIINYNTKFQNYYDTLVTAVENQDSETLKQGLIRLTNSITDNQAEVDELVEELRAFRDKMTEDTQNFKGDANEITSILSSQNAGIPLLQSQITTYNEAVENYNAIIIGSSVATALGPIAIIGGSVVIATGAGVPLGVTLIAGGTASLGGGTTGIILAKQEMDDAKAAIEELTGQISQAEIQVAGLTNVKNQTEYMMDTIDIAITALQNISNQWYTMGSKYNSLLQNVDFIDPDDFFFISEDLSVAKDSWNNIKEYAEKIYAEDIQVVDTDPS